MGLNIADQYYLKAKGAMSGFCSDWEEVCEALGYAISYDDQHCASLCLLGKIQAEYLGDYISAFENFDKCIAANINYNAVYPLYSRMLIWADELPRAKQLIAFAKNIKGASMPELLSCESYIYEVEKKYTKSLKCLKQAKTHVYNDDYMYYIENEMSRVRKKLKKAKKKRKNKTKSKIGFNTLLD